MLKILLKTFLILSIFVGSVWVGDHTVIKLNKSIATGTAIYYRGTGDLAFEKQKYYKALVCYLLLYDAAFELKYWEEAKPILWRFKGGQQ